jgi:hypothetical protein
MEAAIEAGEVRAGDTSRLGELTESYGLPQSAVTKELEQCIERRCAGHVLQAATALRRGQADLVISETEMLLRFNALNPYKVVSTAVQQNEFEVRQRPSRTRRARRDASARARVWRRERALSMRARRPPPCAPRRAGHLPPLPGELHEGRPALGRRQGAPQRAAHCLRPGRRDRVSLVGRALQHATTPQTQRTITMHRRALRCGHGQKRCGILL